MITADQLVAHAVGDYILQSDWMATEKTKRTMAAAAHAAAYAVPFLFLSRSLLPLVVIAGSHFVIDRWRLARFVVWAKNWLAPRWLSVPLGRAGTMERNRPWADCQGTGYPSDRPAWLAVWLLIIADNILHVLINAWALR